MSRPPSVCNMRISTREVAKFLAGACAASAIGHFLIGRTGVLPLKIMGVTLSSALNGLFVFLSAAVSAHLAFYAWRTRPVPIPDAGPPVEPQTAFQTDSAAERRRDTSHVD